MEQYDYFMVYALEDSGERKRLECKPEQLGDILDPEQVYVIVQEPIRRIYIWKGAKSPVRKRFISSRIAGALQEELVKEAAFHRCKIVSIDQGDELEEFLNAFNLESMEVTEKLADMRYIRNIDKQKMLDKGQILDETPQIVKIDKKVKKEKKEEPLPTFAELEEELETIPLPTKAASVKKTISSHPYGPSKPALKAQKTFGLTDAEKKEIIDKIMKEEVPEQFKRQNLILGHSLFGAVNKKVNIFGKEIEETTWELVKNLPEGPIDIEDSKLRVYLNKEKGIVEAVEVLSKIDGKKQPKKKSAPKAKPAPKKSSKASPKRRNLPKVPKS
ncbi:MAG: hypothetical protein ACTSR8_21550 [Promethearchaeota archaeon]